MRTQASEQALLALAEAVRLYKPEDVVRAISTVFTPDEMLDMASELHGIASPILKQVAFEEDIGIEAEQDTAVDFYAWQQDFERSMDAIGQKMEGNSGHSQS